MDYVMEKINEAVEYIRTVYGETPLVGIVLGSGLGNFGREINVEMEIPYTDIPHFPESTVDGHSGKLLFGTLGGKNVVAMAGRFHFYEGYDAQQIVFPVRVMKYLGIKTLLLSNAAGAVNPAFRVGDLMIIKDHISQFTENPLMGKNIKELGPRFPDMSEPYKKQLINKMKAIAASNEIVVQEGVYVAVTGPTFETPAEYHLIKVIGGDAVGMSTVQECIAAVHMGLDVFAMSVITDIAIHEGSAAAVSHDEVLQAAKAAEPKFACLMKELVTQL
jgi:purine-nucleoside phosphorylase